MGSGESSDRISPRLVGVGALIVIAVGVYLRAHGITTNPLWLDEAYSAFAADRGLHFIWAMVPRYESHPPLYYSLLSLWDDAFGITLPVRRALGLIGGISVIIFTGLGAAFLARSLRLPKSQERWLIGISLLLVSLHPLSVMMSREVRPYPLMMMVNAAGMMALIRLAGDQAQQRSIDGASLLVVLIAEALMSWLHTLGVIYAATLSLGLVIAVLRPGLQRRDWLWLIGGEMLVGLLYLPELLIAHQESRAWAGGGWLQFHPGSLAHDIGSIYFGHFAIGRLIGLIATIGGVISIARLSHGRRVAGVLVTLAALPVLVSVGISSLLVPVFLDRTLSPVVVPMLLMAAKGLVWPGRWRWLALFPAFALAGSMAVADGQALRQPKEDWYGAVRWLAAHKAPGDSIWAYPNEVELPLNYALQDKGIRLVVRPIPAPTPALDARGTHPAGTPGSVSLDPRDIENLARSPVGRDSNTLYVVRRFPALYDPDDRFIHALERTRVPVAHYKAGMLNIVALRGRPIDPVRYQAASD